MSLLIAARNNAIAAVTSPAARHAAGAGRCGRIERWPP